MSIFINLRPVERFESGCDMDEFRSLNNTTNKSVMRVLNLLEPIKLTVWKVVIERITVDNGSKK